MSFIGSLDEVKKREIVKRCLARYGFGHGHHTWDLADKPEVVTACLAAAKEIARMDTDERR